MGVGMKTRTVWLWACAFPPSDEAARLAEGLGAMRRAEWERAGVARRAEVLASGLLVKRAFPGSYGAERRDGRGRPFIPGEPSYSLSHAGDRAVLAAAERGDPAAVGCDLERRRERPLSAALLRRAMREDERRRIEASADPWDAFLRRWVLKEAYTKALGRGLQIPFGEIGTRLSPPGLSAVPGEWPFACRFACPAAVAGWRLAVCRIGAEPLRVKRAE
jgi:phosphopantetheinyl transferase